MGYRSEVTFCLQVKNPEVFIGLLKVKDEEILNYFLEHMYLVEGLIHFYASSWKWYPDSQKAFRELMNTAEKYDKNFACRFARVGEETNDIEDESFGETGWDLEFPYTVTQLEIGFDVSNLNPLKSEEKNVSNT